MLKVEENKPELVFYCSFVQSLLFDLSEVVTAGNQK